MARFLCWVPEYGETESDAVLIDDYNAQCAAEEFAELADQNAGGEIAQGLMSGGVPFVVCVKDEAQVERRFKISAEPSVSWLALED